MQKLSTLLFLLPFIASAQMTPAPFPGVAGTTIASVRDFGDTIDFEAYPTGTVITDQYWSNGAIFSGTVPGTYADIYDYGSSLFGRILKSNTWYDKVKLRFVSPEDSTEKMLIRYFTFQNPINSEIDYIKVRFYDLEDSIIFTYTSASPEWVNVDLGSNSAAYVTFDDAQNTAYVVDNIWFSQDSLATATPFVVSNDRVTIYPNPADQFISVKFNEPSSGYSMKIFDPMGRLVFHDQVEGEFIDVSSIHDGAYWLQIETSKEAIVAPVIVKH